MHRMKQQACHRLPATAASSRGRTAAGIFTKVDIPDAWRHATVADCPHMTLRTPRHAMLRRDAGFRSHPAVTDNSALRAAIQRFRRGWRKTA